jgi:hypothetical protein
MKLSDNTSISLPARNLLAILAAVAIGTMSYFTIIERLNSIETTLQLMEKDLEAANTFIDGVPKATWSVHKYKSSTCWWNIFLVM